LARYGKTSTVQPWQQAPLLPAHLVLVPPASNCVCSVHNHHGTHTSCDITGAAVAKRQSTASLTSGQLLAEPSGGCCNWRSAFSPVADYLGVPLQPRFVSLGNCGVRGLLGSATRSQRHTTGGRLQWVSTLLSIADRFVQPITSQGQHACRLHNKFCSRSVHESLRYVAVHGVQNHVIDRIPKAPGWVDYIS
jgi:hypothetical protein